MRSAKSILVVGGGANGVEYIGQLLSTFGNNSKKLGILTRGPRLLPNLVSRASELAELYLRRQGAFVYLNTDFNDDIKRELDYELVVDCTGYKFPGPRDFMRGELTSCLC